MKTYKNTGIIIFVLIFSIQTTLYAPQQKNPITPESLTDQNFSWVHKNLGGMKRPYDQESIHSLNKIGVKLLVTLTEKPLEKSWFDNTDIENLHIPILDFQTPTLQQVDIFIQAAKKLINTNNSVIVHCTAGMGRTGTMLACWLVAERNYTPFKAVEFVREKRPGSIETKEQLQFIGSYSLHVYCKKLIQTKNIDLKNKSLIAFGKETAYSYFQKLNEQELAEKVLFEKNQETSNNLLLSLQALRDKMLELGKILKDLK